MATSNLTPTSPHRDIAAKPHSLNNNSPPANENRETPIKYNPMANHFPSYDPHDPLMRSYQVALRRHATTPPQQTTTSQQPSSTSVIAAPATSMSQDSIHGRFLAAAMKCDTRAMQQEFHHLLSVAESRNQDCLFLKRRHEHEVEANHGEMDWMRARIQCLEEEMRRVTGYKKNAGQACYGLDQNGDVQSR